MVHRTLAPFKFNLVCRFQAKSLAWVKARAPGKSKSAIGDALRLSRVHAEVTLTRRWSQLSKQARAEPSEANVMGCHVRAPRISRIYVGECQVWLSGRSR